MREPRNKQDPGGSERLVGDKAACAAEQKGDGRESLGWQVVCGGLRKEPLCPVCVRRPLRGAHEPVHVKVIGCEMPGTCQMRSLLHLFSSLFSTPHKLPNTITIFSCQILLESRHLHCSSIHPPPVRLFFFTSLFMLFPLPRKPCQPLFVPC